MSLRKFLLIPTLARSGMRAPRDVVSAWNRYWSGVSRTGADGDVLWDAASQAEIAWCLEQQRRHMDPSLPVLDVGCGNGRFTRALARGAARALGVDLSEAAIELARRESAGTSGVEFRALDMTRPHAAEALGAELAPANVFVRGLLHVLSRGDQRALADNLAALLGARGVLVLLETAFPGSSLDYLEFLGARDGALPRQLAHCVESGIPKPSAFGARELARAFPASEWTIIESGAADVHALRMSPQGNQLIPGFYAALRPR